MTTTMPETPTRVSVPDEFSPEPPLAAWDHNLIEPYRYQGHIVRDVRDDSVWLWYMNLLYPARRRSSSQWGEPDWDTGPGTRRSTVDEDVANYRLTRFERASLNREADWSAPNISLDETAREVTKHACRVIVEALNSGYYTEQVDEQARGAMSQWAENANERSVDDDMCGVYDSSVIKYNDRVAAQYPALAWPPRNRPAEDREVEVEINYTIEGTYTMSVTVNVDPDLDNSDADVADAINSVIDDYMSDHLAMDDVRHGNPTINHDSDWELA